MRPFDPKLLRLLPAARVPVAALGLLGILSGFAALAQTFAIASVVVGVARGWSLATPIAWLAGVFAVRALLAGATELVAGWAGVRVSTQLRARVIQRWLGRRADHRDGRAAGDPLTLAADGATSVEPYVARYLPALVSAAVVPLLTIVTLLFVDWISALIVVLTVPLLPLFAALIGIKTREATQDRWGALAALAGHYLDVVRGLPTLVNFGRAQRQEATIEKVGDDHRRATMGTLKIAFMSSAALELLATISVAIVAVAVGLRLATGKMDLEPGLVAILLAPEAYWPIRRVGSEFHSAADGAEAIEQLLPVLEADAEDQASAAPSAPRGEAAAVEIRMAGVRYTHPEAGREVLPGLDLAAAGPGLVTLTGPSGSGKTTLLEVLAGLRTPTHGDVSAPRAHLVTQRPFLIDGTLAENLRLSPGSADADDAELLAALTEVGLDELVARLPAGLESRIGDDGFGLSAGQRARLALARASLDDAPLLLLDEPTAHLDAESAAAAHRLIQRLAHERLVVAVTHREELAELAAIRWALTSTQGVAR